MADEFTNGRALVIGVSRYRHVPCLPAVAHDATDFHALLRDPLRASYPRHQVRLLVDDDATRPAVLSALDRLAKETARGDTVIVYFSGHGGRPSLEPETPSFLLTTEADPVRLSKTAIAAEELTAAFRAIPAARLVVIIDACHAGSSGEPKDGIIAPLPLVGLTKESLEGLASGTGRVVLASCRPDERSWIEHGARNSLFTGHLLSAFRGGLRSADRYIRVLDLFNYVAGCVTTARSDQHPILKASIEENFPLAMSAAVAVTVEATTSVSPTTSQPSSGPEPGEAWWRELLEVSADLFPGGPAEDDLWKRAGGDRSRLPARGNARSAWYAALNLLKQGGGGAGITPTTLLGGMRADFPHHVDLLKLEAALRPKDGHDVT